MDPNTSLSQLIAEGLVIQTEFSSPKKRQTHSPAPSRRPVSTRLVADSDKPTYKSPVKEWKAHALNYEAVHSTKVEDRKPKPEINTESRKMWTRWKPESVESRLMRLEKERKQRLALIVTKATADKDSEFDYTPKTNQRTGTKRSPEAVSLHLYESGLAEIRRKQEAGGSVLLQQFSSVQETAPEPRETHSKSPVRRALNLFSKAKIPLRDFLARNYWAPLHKLQRSVSPICDLNDSECCFHPQINQSCVISTNASSVYERLTSKQRISREKVYEKCRDLLETEASQCTFQPSLYPRSKTPPPSTFATRKVPLRSRAHKDTSAEIRAVHRSSQDTVMSMPVKYTDSRNTTFSLAVTHCSGDWEVIHSLEDVESRMSAFGMAFK